MAVRQPDPCRPWLCPACLSSPVCPFFLAALSCYRSGLKTASQAVQRCLQGVTHACRRSAKSLIRVIKSISTRSWPVSGLRAFHAGSRRCLAPGILLQGVLGRSWRHAEDVGVREPDNLCEPDQLAGQGVPNPSPSPPNAVGPGQEARKLQRLDGLSSRRAADTRTLRDGGIGGEAFPLALN